MKDRIDGLPFSQDWPDRATSSTLQRGFNPGEPRNNHLPAIHPFACRSLLLLESSAVWPGINVSRSPFLGFLSCQYLPTSRPSPFPFHIRQRLNNSGVLIPLANAGMRRKRGTRGAAVSRFPESEKKIDACLVRSSFFPSERIGIRLAIRIHRNQPAFIAGGILEREKPMVFVVSRRR